MIQLPPISWNDCLSLGIDSSAIFKYNDDTKLLSIEPKPKKLVLLLITALLNNPPPSPEDDKMAYLRHIRDILITLTDWTQYNDSPLSESDKLAWKMYRYELRNLPQNYNGEETISWPVIPD